MIKKIVLALFFVSLGAQSAYLSAASATVSVDDLVAKYRSDTQALSVELTKQMGRSGKNKNLQLIVNLQAAQTRLQAEQREAAEKEAARIGLSTHVLQQLKGSGGAELAATKKRLEEAERLLAAQKGHVTSGSSDEAERLQRQAEALRQREEDLRRREAERVQSVAPLAAEVAKLQEQLAIAQKTKGSGGGMTAEEEEKLAKLGEIEKVIATLGVADQVKDALAKAAADKAVIAEEERRRKEVEEQKQAQALELAKQAAAKEQRKKEVLAKFRKAGHVAAHFEAPQRAADLKKKPQSERAAAKQKFTADSHTRWDAKIVDADKAFAKKKDESAKEITMRLNNPDKLDVPASLAAPDAESIPVSEDFKISYDKFIAGIKMVNAQILAFEAKKAQLSYAPPQQPTKNASFTEVFPLFIVGDRLTEDEKKAKLSVEAKLAMQDITYLTRFVVNNGDFTEQHSSLFFLIKVVYNYIHSLLPDGDFLAYSSFYSANPFVNTTVKKIDVIKHVKTFLLEDVDIKLKAIYDSKEDELYKTAVKKLMQHRTGMDVDEEVLKSLVAKVSAQKKARLRKESISIALPTALDMFLSCVARICSNVPDVILPQDVSIFQEFISYIIYRHRPIKTQFADNAIRASNQEVIKIIKASLSNPSTDFVHNIKINPRVMIHIGSDKERFFDLTRDFIEILNRKFGASSDPIKDSIEKMLISPLDKTDTDAVQDIVKDIVVRFANKPILTTDNLGKVFNLALAALQKTKNAADVKKRVQAILDKLEQFVDVNDASVDSKVKSLFDNLREYAAGKIDKLPSVDPLSQNLNKIFEVHSANVVVAPVTVQSAVKVPFASPDQLKPILEGSVLLDKELPIAVYCRELMREFNSAVVTNNSLPEKDRVSYNKVIDLAVNFVVPFDDLANRILTWVKAIGSNFFTGKELVRIQNRYFTFSLPKAFLMVFADPNIQKMLSDPRKKLNPVVDLKSQVDYSKKIPLIEVLQEHMNARNFVKYLEDAVCFWREDYPILFLSSDDFTYLKNGGSLQDLISRPVESIVGGSITISSKGLPPPPSKSLPPPPSKSLPPPPPVKGSPPGTGTPSPKVPPPPPPPVKKLLPVQASLQRPQYPKHASSDYNQFLQEHASIIETITGNEALMKKLGFAIGASKTDLTEKLNGIRLKIVYNWLFEAKILYESISKGDPVFRSFFLDKDLSVFSEDQLGGIYRILVVINDDTKNNFDVQFDEQGDEAAILKKIKEGLPAPQVVYDKIKEEFPLPAEQKSYDIVKRLFGDAYASVYEIIVKQPDVMPLEAYTKTNKESWFKKMFSFDDVIGGSVTLHVATTKQPTKIAVQGGTPQGGVVSGKPLLPTATMEQMVNAAMAKLQDIFLQAQVTMGEIRTMVNEAVLVPEQAGIADKAAFDIAKEQIKKDWNALQAAFLRQTTTDFDAIKAMSKPLVGTAAEKNTLTQKVNNIVAWHTQLDSSIKDKFEKLKKKIETLAMP